MFLRQSTTKSVKIGPFLDKTDGVTEETGITPVVEVSKDHGAFGARNSATAITHDAEGYFLVELDTTDTNTVGRLRLKAHDSATHLPVWEDYWVLEEAIFDAIYAASANVFEGAAGSNAVRLVTTTTTNTDMRGTDNAALASVATEARLAELDAANIPTDIANVQSDTDDIQTRLPAALVGGRMDSDIGAKTGNVALSTQEKADVNTEVDSAFTTQMADSVSTDGSIATREQAIYMILQALTEFAISGTTLTVKKVDGTTTLFTGTLDDGTNPTSLTRAT